MNTKTKSAYLSVIVISLVFGFASLVAVAKNDNTKNDKSDKTSQSQGKSEDKTVNLKNFEKPDKIKGETNAQVHKEKIKEVNQELKQVATEEQSTGNSEVGNQIQQVVTEQEQSQEQIVEAIEEVESRGKVKTFLIGTDYKNLGQLRSSLVHNRNQIRKLTQTMAQVQNEGEQTLLQEQLQILMQERERIKTVITANESNFSLFGWVSRFLSNYEQTPINEQEENDLTEEVEEAIETADATIPTIPVTTPETMPVTPVQ